MQDGVREEDVKFTEVEKTLIVLVLGNGSGVSLTWYNSVVTYNTSALVQGM